MSRILIVGADGMIGFGLYTYFSQLTDRDVYASIRSKRDLACFGATDAVSHRKNRTIGIV